MDKCFETLPVDKAKLSPYSNFPPEAEISRRRSNSSTLIRRKSTDTHEVPPPSYSPSPPQSRPGISESIKHKFIEWWKKPPKRIEILEDELELLRKYDTVILVDDSGSMNEIGSKDGVTRWDEAGKALELLAETAQEYDSDGIDIHFLNNEKKALNMKSSTDVRNIFDKARPFGGTPTGQRLKKLINPHIVRLEAARIDADGTPRDRKTGQVIKRVNFIVITDGVATDDPATKNTIIKAATHLKALTNLCSIQVGIQFVQIGNDDAATKALKALDDDLHKAGNIRDIVDTTPYAKLNPVTAEGLIKVLLGGINRRIDEQNNQKNKC